MGRAAARGRVHDPEGVEERVDDVDHEQEERGRREQREDDGPEPLERARAVDGRGLDQRAGDGLEPGEEEQEVVADLLPRGGDDDEDHRVVAVEVVVPVVAERLQEVGEDPDGWVEHEEPQHASHRRGDGVGPDDQRAVRRRSLDDAVRHRREQERRAQRQRRGRDGEQDSSAEALKVDRVREQAGEVVEPDELAAEPEGVLEQDGLVEGLARRPDEEDERDDDLRGDQRKGQPPPGKCDALFQGIRGRATLFVLGQGRMDSRLRGNDGENGGDIIPAKAEIHRCSPMACGRIPDTSAAGAIAVIPAKAGIHRCSPITRMDAPDAPSACAVAVIPAFAGIHRFSGIVSHEHIRRTRICATVGSAAPMRSFRGRRASRSRSTRAGRPQFAASNLRSSSLPRETAASSPFLRGLVAGPDRLELLVDDVADLDEAAEPQPLGVLRRRLPGHLDDRHVRARVRVVEALRLGELGGGGGDREVTGELVPVRLHLGRGQVAEELRHALVLLGVTPLEHPQRRAADDGVLRGALDVRPVGQGGDGEVEVLGVGLHPGVGGGRVHVHHAFLAVELRRAVGAPAAVVEDLGLLPLGELTDVLHVHGAVEDELGVHAREAVGLGADRLVVPRREVLDLDPGLPAGGEAAGVAGGLRLHRGRLDFRPGLRRFRDSRLLERVLVVVQHRGGAVERHRQHVAVGVGVVAGDRCQVVARVERFARVRHQLVDGIDGALRGHHAGGAHLEDLHDVRLLLRAERRDGGGHGLGVVALVDGRHLVVGLGCVEALGDLDHLLAQLAAHGVPPLDLGGGLGEPGEGEGDGCADGGGQGLVFHLRSLRVGGWALVSPMLHQ